MKFGDWFERWRRRFRRERMTTMLPSVSMRQSWDPPEVFALVGKQGTGKSFRALLVAESHSIDGIIDDGLFIRSGKIVAGRSAKKEAHYIRAVKTALFYDPEHRAEVMSAIRSSGMKRILLLGTSERMIVRNCETLGLPEPGETIRIEDVATREEIEAAMRDRRRHGKHIIPLPVIEVHRAYPKMVAEAVRVLLRKGWDRVSHPRTYEKTVVRPTFHSRGRITISETALTQMVLHCLREKTPGVEMKKIKMREQSEGYLIKIHLIFPFGLEVTDRCHNLQQYTIRQVERFTGIQIIRLEIEIDSIEAAAPVSRET